VDIIQKEKEMGKRIQLQDATYPDFDIFTLYVAHSPHNSSFSNKFKVQICVKKGKMVSLY
jgi:hypothetical protein